MLILSFEENSPFAVYQLHHYTHPEENSVRLTRAVLACSNSEMEARESKTTRQDEKIVCHPVRIVKSKDLKFRRKFGQFVLSHRFHEFSRKN